MALVGRALSLFLFRCVCIIAHTHIMMISSRLLTRILIRAHTIDHDEVRVPGGRRTAGLQSRPDTH